MRTYITHHWWDHFDPEELYDALYERQKDREIMHKIKEEEDERERKRKEKESGRTIV